MAVVKPAKYEVDLVDRTYNFVILQTTIEGN